MNTLLFLCFLRDTFVLCLVNGGSSFVAGFAIFSVLGFMSYEQGLPISEVAASGKTTVLMLLDLCLKNIGITAINLTVLNRCKKQLE